MVGQQPRPSIVKSDAYQTQNQDPDLLLRPDQRAKLGNVPAHPVPLLVCCPSLLPCS